MSSGPKQRVSTLLGVLSTLALLLGACTTAATPAPAAPQEAGPTQAPEPTQAPAATPKVLIVASGQDVPSIDPHTYADYSTRAMHRNLYDPLVRYEGNPPKAVPNLAESWTISPDGLEYTFKLVKNAKFHDGSPVTAEAVKYSFNRSLTLKKGGNWMFASAMDENSTEVVDDYTVKITLTKPFAPFLAVLPWMFVVNPALVEANAGEDSGQTWLKDHEAGSGPFVIKRWEPGTLYELERFPDYWRSGGGNLTGAIWKITRETSSQRLAVQTGDVHIAVDLTGDDMDFLKGSSGVVLIEQPEFRTFSIKMNYQHGPLTDPALRKAVSYAFDYDAMLEAEGEGHAQLMIGPLPPNILGADPSLDVPRMDLDKAKEWLAKSEYPDGGGLTLSYVYVSGLEIERKFGLILLDSLKQLNINLDVKQLVWPDMVALSKDPTTTPDFFPVFQTANYADPDNIAFAAYHSSQNGNWSNPTYNNPKADELIQLGRTTLAETDRIKIYGDLQKQIVEDAPDIFGVLENRKLAMRDSITGWSFVPIASNAIEYFPLSLK